MVSVIGYIGIVVGGLVSLFLFKWIIKLVNKGKNIHSIEQEEGETLSHVMGEGKLSKQMRDLKTLLADNKKIQGILRKRIKQHDRVEDELQDIAHTEKQEEAEEGGDDPIEQAEERAVAKVYQMEQQEEGVDRELLKLEEKKGKEEEEAVYWEGRLKIYDNILSKASDNLKQTDKFKEVQRNRDTASYKITSLKNHIFQLTAQIRMIERKQKGTFQKAA
tara:strand:- start:4695 stop:5351 length:657 start_codon:yes stop_codon:yes gene_type:complete